MRIALRVSPFAPLPEVVAFTRRCEAAGFDAVGFLDSQMIDRDVFVTMAAAAFATERLGLISAVTNPVTRHPSVLASAAASLDDIAPGRIELWLGRGYSSINLAGLSAATTRQLGQAARDIRRLLAGDWDVLPGAHSRMRASPKQVPVYIAAAGPRTLRLAGAVADGVLVAGSLLWPAVQRAREQVVAGAREAGRDPSQVSLCLALLTCVRDSREQALRWAAPLIVPRLASHEWLREAGIDARGLQPPPALDALYPDAMHAEDHAAAMKIASEIPLEVTAAIAEKLGLVGTPADVSERLRDVAAHGFDYVFMRTVDTLAFPEPEVEAFRDLTP